MLTVLVVVDVGVTVVASVAVQMMVIVVISRVENLMQCSRCYYKDNILTTIQLFGPRERTKRLHKRIIVGYN